MNLCSPFRLASALALVALLLGGCWKDRLFWSPDGSRAAIVTPEGLRFSDVNGHLTAVLAAGVYRAAWLGDSQRLVLARSREIKDWAMLSAALGPERTKTLAAKAETIWQLWQASTTEELTRDYEGSDDMGGMIVYLREHHGAALRKKFSEDPKNDPKDLETMAATWHSLVVGRLVGDRLELGAPLHEGLAAIHDIRPAPGRPVVAFVTGLELSPVPDAGAYTYLMPLDTPTPAVLVASHTGLNPDWTPDGRTLVYLKGARDRGAVDELQLGALVEREVLDATGHIQLAEKTRDLVGLIFQGENRVRCLRDGRVLFDAAEIRLPLAGRDRRPTKEQLFTLDRTKDDAPLVALIPEGQREAVPDVVTPFEVSPDEKHILIPAGADVVLVTVATGAVERLKLGMFNDNERSPPRAVWRGPGELTYVKIGAPRNELVLRRDGTETVLSRDWSDTVLKQLVE
jgi:hypothetical protein